MYNGIHEGLTNEYRVGNKVSYIILVYKGERKEVMVDTEDLLKLLKSNITSVFLHKTKASEYVRCNMRGRKKIYLHRFLMEDEMEEGKVVDHINRNPLDNRKCNLRIITRAENNQNRGIGKDNKSGYRGVSFNKNYNRWAVHITINGEKKYGYFKTKEEAIKQAGIWYKKHMPYYEIDIEKTFKKRKKV